MKKPSSSVSEAGHRAFWAQCFADGWGLCKNATDGLTPRNPWRYSIRGNHIEGRAGWPSNERARASLRSVLNFAGLFRGVFVESAPVGKTLRSKRSMTGFWHGAGKIIHEYSLKHLKKGKRCKKKTLKIFVLQKFKTLSSTIFNIVPKKLIDFYGRFFVTLA